MHQNQSLLINVDLQIDTELNNENSASSFNGFGKKPRVRKQCPVIKQNPRYLEKQRGCQRQFKIDPLIDVIAEVKLIHPRN